MKYLLSAALIALLFSSCVKDRPLPVYTPLSLGTRQLIHYWNFNDTSSATSVITPTYTVGGGALSFDFASVGGVAGFYDFLYPSPTLLNARNGDGAGALLRVRNPSIDMIITAPTTHYKNIILQYAVALSSTTSGALLDSVYYTVDGTNYINTGIIPTYSAQADPAYQVMSYDLSSISAVNNNPNFKFKVVFLNGNLNSRGNTRFDNITVDADTSNAIAPPPVVALLHYWNFNAPAFLTPTYTLGAGSLAFDYSTVTLTHVPNDSVARVDVVTLNARNGDVPGNALRVRSPITSFIINAPTTNYKNIVLTYAVAKSSSGSATDSVYYSTDGVNFINSGITPSSYTVATDPAYIVISYDFSSISAVSNNPNFQFKIVIVGANTATSGNNRFDNLTVEGVHQ